MSVTLEPKLLANLPAMKIDYQNFRPVFDLKRKKSPSYKVGVVTWENGSL